MSASADSDNVRFWIKKVQWESPTCMHGCIDHTYLLALLG